MTVCSSYLYLSLVLVALLCDARRRSFADEEDAMQLLDEKGVFTLEEEIEMPLQSEEHDETVLERPLRLVHTLEQRVNLSLEDNFSGNASSAIDVVSQQSGEAEVRSTANLSQLEVSAEHEAVTEPPGQLSSSERRSLGMLGMDPEQGPPSIGARLSWVVNLMNHVTSYFPHMPICSGCVEIHATSPKIAARGRMVRDLSQGTLRFDWSHAGVSFETLGRPAEVWVRLDSGSQYLNVYVNGKHAKVIGGEVSARERQYLLVQAARDVNITLSKRTEPMSNTLSPNMPVTLFGVMLRPSDATPNLVASNVPRRVIEFVGDSSTSAYGSEHRSATFSLVDSSSQDIDRGFAWMVARAFGAEANVIGWSGAGVTSKSHPMPHIYPRILGSDPATMSKKAATTAELGRADLIVLLIGVNDVAGGASLAAITKGMTEFLEIIGLFQPGVPILALCPDDETMVGMTGSQSQDVAAVDLQTAVTKAARLSGAIVWVRRITPHPRLDIRNDGDWSVPKHMSERGHRKFAHGLVPIVSEIMGWEADEGF